MPVSDNKIQPERGKTDESLRDEREKTDRALAQGQAGVEAHADEVLNGERETADAVLVEARHKADQLSQNPPTSGVRAAVIRERALEDEILREERAIADETLLRDRDEHAAVLAKLLPLEREKTDRYLLTERARSDDALANRDDFLGMVTHDLRDLLGGIALSAAILSKNASQKEETNRIQRYAARMNRLIGDLVDVASIDAGKLAVTAATGDANTLVTEAVDGFQGIAAAKGISLEARIVERPLPAAFDHDRLIQVLTNLIANSVKFTPDGGRVWVQVERAVDECRFSVHDTGPGIPGDLLEIIFERFWQVGKNDRRGLGLGLYISRCIVEAHGGRIWAESKLGEGSSFFFTLPAYETRRL